MILSAEVGVIFDLLTRYLVIGWLIFVCIAIALGLGWGLDIGLSSFAFFNGIWPMYAYHMAFGALEKQLRMHNYETLPELKDSWIFQNSAFVHPSFLRHLYSDSEKLQTVVVPEILRFFKVSHALAAGTLLIALVLANTL